MYRISIMEKKLYMTPAVEVVATEAEELLAGSFELNEEGGTGTVSDEIIDVPGLGRIDLLPEMPELPFEQF